MSVAMRKFGVVLWKNVILKGRHWIQTTLEVVVPCLLFIALVVIRSAITYEASLGEDVVMANVHHFFDDQSGMRSFCWSRYSGKGRFYVAPTTSEYAQRFVEDFNLASAKFCYNSGWTSSENYIVAELVDSEQEIVDRYTAYASQLDLLRKKSSDELEQDDIAVYGGVIFDADQTMNSPTIKYKLRFGYTNDYYQEAKTQYLFDPFGQYDMYYANDADYDYVTETAFQAIIELLFIQNRLGQEVFIPIQENYTDDIVKYSLSDQGLAIPGKNTNYLALILDYIMPMFSVMSFMFVVPPLLKRIVQEKHSGVKEFMKMSGLPGYMNWTAWFLTAFVSCLITNIIILILLGVNFSQGAVLEYSDLFVVFISFTLYSMALIAMLFTISTFFNNANLALVAGILIHLVSFFVPYGILGQNDQFYVNVSFGSKMGLALLPNMGLWFILKGILRSESSAIGVTFSSLNDPIIPGDGMTILYAWIMFLVSVLIYGILIWYIDTVKPGPFGQARPFYFPFMKSYWFPSKESIHSQDSDDPDIYSEVWEPEPEGQPGVQVRNLRKYFSRPGGTTIKAVQNVRFSAFPGQIMALLGHNGAGKTTTMSMLTGLFSSTSGTALVNGHNINTSMSKIRGSLGLCPQHNMLFDSLTVREHLIFFGMLKGLSWKKAHNEADSVAQKVLLGEKVGNMSTALSGGMKRKLHLGIALMGNSSVVLLDEPTSGMDPEARREIWDLLHDIKANRTVILTTHFMEEADVLGDRIAIMAEGRVQCYGSSLFLKRAYGSGYRLTMTKTPSCDAAKIKAKIREHIPNAQTLSNVSGELAMSLSTEEEDKFSGLLKELASCKADLGIANFGLSVTTLEDVFLKVGSKTEDTETLNMQDKKLKRVASIESGYTADRFRKPRNDLATGVKLWLLQMKGLLTKRVIQTKRNWIMYLIMAVVPIIMSVLAGVLTNIISQLGGLSETEPRTMNFGQYTNDKTTSLLNKNLSTPFADKTYAIFEDYIDQFPRSQVLELENFDKFLLENGAGDGLQFYGHKYILGFSVHEYEHYMYYTSSRFNVIELNGHFNVIPLHARPLVRNILTNIFNVQFFPQKATMEDIQVTYEPIIVTQAWERFWYGDTLFYPSVLVYSILLSVAWILFIGIFVIFPIRERLSSAKQVQIMAGVHPVTFWLSNLVWDAFLTLVITAIVLVLICLLDKRNLFLEPQAWGSITLIHVLFGFGGLLTAYVFSFFTKSAPAAFAFYVLLALVCGVVMPIGVWFMSLVDYELIDEVNPMNQTGPNLALISDVLRYTISLYPAMPMTRALMAIVQVSEENGRCVNNIPTNTLNAVCKTFSDAPALIDPVQGWQLNLNVAACCDEKFLTDPSNAICGRVLSYCIEESCKSFNSTACAVQTNLFTFDRVKGINIDLIYLSGTILLIMGLLYGLEVGFIQRTWGRLYELVCRAKPGYEPEPLLDEDVLKEQEQAIKAAHDPTSDRESVLVVNNLTKNFGKFRAVRGLSFTVKQGECFGFLGVNGAGKTTSFRMLTGDEFRTSGKANLYGHDLKGERAQFLKQIGYCPQFDSIISVLTGREILNLFAHIRGVPLYRMEEEVNKWIGFVGLKQYADRKCGQYSGGNKRKLNVAQALVGDPPIIFLDEPSTGVDPVARRKLWDAITNIKSQGQSVVLTSHSMEECEALCDRISIMVKGQFRCLGGPQHLKNKYGQGFTIIVKMNQAHPAYDSERANEQVKELMTRRFPNIRIKDEHKDYVHLHIPDTNTPWFALFESMQKAKEELAFIQDYSLNETSLEDVFLLFARGEHDKRAQGEEDTSQPIVTGGVTNEGFVQHDDSAII